MKTWFAWISFFLIAVIGFTRCSGDAGAPQDDEQNVREAKAQANGLVTQEIRYHNAAVGKVLLGWGVDGWNILPEEQFTNGTFVQNKVMHTPMAPDGDGFVVQVQVPDGAIVDYGFYLIKDANGAEIEVWDGDYQITAVSNTPVTIEAKNLLSNNDTAAGEQLFGASCAACHGATGQGIPNLGKNLQESSFVDSLSDAELAEFIKNGRSADDPLNTTGVPMPPYGGNTALTDQDIANLVAYIRTLSANEGTVNDSPEEGELWVEAEPRVVEGFSITPFLQLPEKYPTCLAFGSDGFLYVCTYDGTIWAVADADGNGQGDEPRLFAEGFQRPVGLLWHEDTLYVASAGQITAVRDQDDNGEADEQHEVISGLPAGIYPIHANNDLVMGKDGRLYFGVGATSNSSPETHQYAASILSINPDGSDLQVVATGVRNPFDLAFNANGDLFATDNGPDGADWANNTPPDELNHIMPNGAYGFPDQFGTSNVNSKTLDPTWPFPPHSAPAGIVFYSADKFPDEYQDNAFVALWTRSQLYRLQFAQIADGQYAAKGTVFASGLTGAVDVVVGPDGNLYVSASETGTIYRISYDQPNS